MILRQKKAAYIQQLGYDFQPLKEMGFQPGASQILQEISCNKELRLSPFNWVVRWRRKSRGKLGKDCWYLLTSLSNLEQVLAAYQARWRIETMFKNCKASATLSLTLSLSKGKTGGYNLEQTRVNSIRLLALFLLITLAYTLSILEADSLHNREHFSYITSIHQGEQPYPYHSDFALGLLALAWSNSMTLWSNIAWALMQLKPHKRLYFQQGLNALSSIQQPSWLSCHP